MSIKLRFAVVLGLLLLAFAASLLTLHTLERRQAERLVVSSREERRDLLVHWMELTGSSLRQFASDYSLWDEMVHYIEQPDPAWAQINIEPALGNFNLHAIWVLRADGSLLSTHGREGARPGLPLAPEDFDALLGKGRFPHFFADSPAGLLEIRGAPIQPSADIPRTGPSRGWLLVARHWDPPHIESLGRLTESSARVIDVGAEAPRPRDPAFAVQLSVPLKDWRERPLRVLHLEHQVQALREVVAIDVWEGRIFFSFGVGMILVLGLSLYYWILRPLSAISESMATGTTAVIQPLLGRRDELGRVAQLIESSIVQRRALHSEIEERKRVEEALRASQEHLRRTIEGRAQLGRDLHDGVIQTLYSAGLGVATAQRILRVRPDDAESTLGLCRRTLNDTIRDVRNFITGLEPEELTRISFSDIVHNLLGSLHGLHPARSQVEIDATLGEELGATHKANLLQIVREAASNALRHGRATLLVVQLERAGEDAVLRIADNGCGFLPGTPQGGGRGLRNLEARAIELNGVLDVSARPEGGVSVTVRFTLPSTCS